MQDGLMFPHVFNIDSMRFSSYFQETAECQGHVFGWGRASTNKNKKKRKHFPIIFEIKNYFRTILVHRNAYLVHRNAYLVHRNAYLVHRSAYLVHRNAFLVHRNAYLVHRTVLESFFRNFPHQKTPTNLINSRYQTRPYPCLPPKTQDQRFGGF